MNHIFTRVVTFFIVADHVPVSFHKYVNIISQAVEYDKLIPRKKLVPEILFIRVQLTEAIKHHTNDFIPGSVRIYPRGTHKSNKIVISYQVGTRRVKRHEGRVLEVQMQQEQSAGNLEPTGIGWFCKWLVDCITESMWSVDSLLVGKPNCES